MDGVQKVKLHVKTLSRTEAVLILRFASDRPWKTAARIWLLVYMVLVGPTGPTWLETDYIRLLVVHFHGKLESVATTAPLHIFAARYSPSASSSHQVTECTAQSKSYSSVGGQHQHLVQQSIVPKPTPPLSWPLEITSRAQC